jgi:hypothetical protein
MMKVVAHNLDTPRKTTLYYGDLDGQVISSSDLGQTSFKSVYLIIPHPTDGTQQLMVPLEGPLCRPSVVLRSTPLGTGYIVRPNATLILDPK